MAISTKLKADKKKLEKEVKKLQADLQQSKEKNKDLQSKLKESGKADKHEIEGLKEERDQAQQKLDEITPLFGELSLECARLKKQLRK